MSRSGANERKPQSVDVYAGQRIRLRRAMLGMTQEQLAEKAGITFQQVQKYERGANRMSVSRLYEFAQFLGVSFEYFIEGFQQTTAGKRTRGFAEQDQAGFTGADGNSDRDSAAIIKVLHSVPADRRKEFIAHSKANAKLFQ